MHPFPPADEFQCLVGEEIEQVCLGPWQVQFHFGFGAVLTLEEGLRLHLPDGTAEAYDCDAAEGAALSLHRLLMKKIVGIERQELSLHLTFENGAKLTVLSEIGPYESGQFSTPSGRYLVF